MLWNAELKPISPNWTITKTIAGGARLLPTSLTFSRQAINPEVIYFRRRRPFAKRADVNVTSIQRLNIRPFVSRSLILHLIRMPWFNSCRWLRFWWFVNIRQRPISIIIKQVMKNSYGISPFASLSSSSPMLRSLNFVSCHPAVAYI